MPLSDEQLHTLAIVGRCASVLSILGVATIIGTFSSSRHFRNPIHRIIFINAFYNLFDFTATMISISGPEAGNGTALCQFQGFLLQIHANIDKEDYRFPLADVLWTLAMACDVFLAVFYHYDAEALRKLEMKYIGVITTLVFTPAITFLFIRTPERGHMYGSQTLWCSISPKWVLFRIIFYYGPIWFIIVVVMILYCLVGMEIVKLRHKFKLTSNDHITQASITSANNVSFDHPNNAVTMTVEANVQSQPVHIAESHGRKESVSALLSKSSTNQISTSHLHPSNSITLDHRPPKQVSFREYVFMPLMFFIALLATWLAPTINRISAFINPGHESYPLLLAVGAMGSLRGFWNGVVFITIGVKGRRWRTKLRKRTGTS